MNSHHRILYANAASLDLTSNYDCDYDVLDRVIKVTDSLGNEVINNFDANGQLWKVTHRYKKPDNSYEVRDVITKTFDAAERVKTETDADGGVTSYGYDPVGNLIAVTDAEGHTTQYEYDAMGRKTAVIDATGYRTESRYNQRGDLLSVSNATGERQRFEYDELGRKTAHIDPQGFRSEFSYDANNNLTCIKDANALSATNAAGHQPLNADGCSESRRYDELNRLSQSKDAQNAVTSYSCDLQGHRLSITDAENKVWRFAYDDLGRLSSETDHSGKLISYQSDEAGNVYEKTNRLNETSRYRYDNGNRITRVDYLKDNTYETFGYDPAGNKNAAGNDTVNYSFQYDNLNRLLNKTDDRQGLSLSFSYDKVGNILTKTTYQGSTTHYTYNAANRLTSLNNPDYLQVDYQYDPAGHLLSRIMSAGARSLYRYNTSGQLTTLSQFDAAGTQVQDSQYTRDRTGNILSQTETGGANPGTSTYTYDPEYRLKTADYPGTTSDEVFSYDKVGNRKTYTQGSLVNNANTRYYNYTTGANRLADIRIGSATGSIESSYSHNDEGQLISQTGANAKTITWDAKGRMHSLGTETYAYDPMDYRIARSGGSLGSLDYLLEGEHLESVYQTGVLKEKYFRGATVDELVAGYLTGTDGKSKPYLFHHDQLTSNTAVSGHNGGTLQVTSYSAFGSTLNSTGSSPNRLKYTGRENEGNGCYYYRARYYCTREGRFLSEDPIGFAGGINLYAYVNNNPINANDPTGQYAEVTVDGNNVNIVIPIRYTGSGKTDSNVAQYTNGIQDTWSPKAPVGNYVVNTQVKQLSFLESLFTSNAHQNRINITPTNQMPPGDGHYGNVSGCPACTGQWPASIAVKDSTLGDIGGHEAGHLMGLLDTKTPGVIMGPYNPQQGLSPVQPQDIRNVMRANNHGDGNLTLYPSFSSVSAIQSVYRK